MKRLLTIVLSAVLFATILSWLSYEPAAQREPNVYYFGFKELFMIFIMYAGPFYLLAGLPLSILNDKLIEKSNRNSKWAKYLVGLGIYSLAGAFVGVMFPIILGENIFQLEIFSFSIHGIIASNLYFHLALVISKIMKQ